MDHIISAACQLPTPDRPFASGGVVSAMKHLPFATHGIYYESGGSVPVRRTCRARLEQWHVPHALHRFDTSLGVTTVVSAGTSTGCPPVVLLPGADLNAAMSLATVCALRGQHRVLVPDIPGAPGLSSSRRPHRYRHQLPVYGHWLDELLPQLCPDPVTLVGHSLGAGIALASTPSDRVTKLILLNPAGIVTMRRTRELTWLRTKWRLHPTLEHSEQLLSYLMSPRFIPDMSLVSWYSMVADLCFPCRLPRRLPARIVRRWSGIPVVVATGEHDRLVPPQLLRPRVRSLLGVDIHTLPQVGHLALRESPDAVAELITSAPSNQREAV
ncbi:alpha/beta fold hydrolase [Rhodococcus tibetensis]|uniref:Alpha/beta hydrolase n=1 Tax=Rhodococcus tibetensis TaxID=2965064 RepID=A0ABT1QG97_9NOCA|nr:alpha/beta hydrolase [Rhodococcus sp. FXJ9.536]MCQ4121280.1 alpha/beta hydrolase [Rhodococcus sp. FXJ9.536]